MNTLIYKFWKVDLVFITIAVGILFQILLVFGTSFNFLLLNVLPDDAFYYFNIARNIIEGNGSTFDGININNGYHPLWMLLLLPIFKFFSIGGVSDLSPIYAALSLSILLNLLSVIVIRRIMLLYTKNKYIIASCIALILFNPHIIYSSLNGLETTLMLLLLFLFSYLLLTIGNLDNTKLNFAFGIVSGLLILARLDMILVVICGYLFLYYKFLFNISNRNQFRLNINKVAIPTLVTAIIFLTWQIYNYKTFGIMLTTASVTGTYVNHFLTYTDNGGESIFVILKTMVYMFDRALVQLYSNLGAGYIYFAMLGVFMYFYFKDNSITGRLKDKSISPLFFVLIGLILLFFISASVRWTFRSWYFIPHIYIFITTFFFALIILEKEFNKFKSILSVILLLVITFYFISWEKDLKNREILQDTIFKAVVWQNDNLPEGSKIGSFNAGIQGYFTRHTLINLDGLVNASASEYMLKHEMWKYITEVENLNYISDFPKYFDYRYRYFFGIPAEQVLEKLELIHSTTSNGNTVGTYKI